MTYGSLKANKTTRGLLQNYHVLKKDDIRNNTVRQFVNGQENLHK